jgi:hypothetical protein
MHAEIVTVGQRICICIETPGLVAEYFGGNPVQAISKQ